MKTLVCANTRTIYERLKPRLQALAFDWKKLNTEKMLSSKLQVHQYELSIVVVGAQEQLKNYLKIIRNLKSNYTNMPIIVIGQDLNLAERLDALEIGADLVLDIGLNYQELEARITNLIKRSNSKAIFPASLSGNLLQVEGRQVQLSNTEAKIVRLLLNNPDKVFSKEELLQTLYKNAAEKRSNVMNVYINRLRNKFRKTGIDNLIKTVDQWGYKFNLS